jgi:hypothetical protein
MNNYKDFIIKLQTLDIKISQKRSFREGVQREYSIYDISHQNPYLSDTFRNELKELRELALTDILNLLPEQIELQLQRLAEVKELFNKFWDKRYSLGSPFLTEHLTNFLYDLNLSETFIVPRLSAEDHVEADDNLINDLEDTINARQKVLKEFEQRVLKVIQPGKALVKFTIDKPNRKEEAKPVFKEGAAEEFYELVKDYFRPVDQSHLKNLLMNQAVPKDSLLFRGTGNQLADAFKQLFEANLIIACNKIELINWIIEHFEYVDRGAVKKYSEKYLLDIISSNTKSCQSPILNVRKKDGQFIILPLQRNNRNNKNLRGLQADYKVNRL